MASRVVSLTIGLGSALALFIGSACGSIPDSRKILPDDYDAGDGTGGKSGGSGGGSPDGGETGGQPGSGGSIGSGGKGLGGSGGTGDEDGGSGGNGTGGVTGKACGVVRCSDVTIGATTLPACCTGPAGRRCGLDFADVITDGQCVEVNAPGQANTSCPTRSDADGTYRGCCRTDTNSCGILLQSGPVNFGCVDPQIQGFPTGGSCTPVQCKLEGATCEDKTECCTTTDEGAACVDFDGSGSRCAQYCTENAQCASGCCATLTSGFGACSPNPADCSDACRALGESCDGDSDCCSGSVCAGNGSRGPKTCHAPCTTDATCTPEFCVPDPVSGHRVCTYDGQGLCTDACIFADDGECDDGGPGSTTIECTLGSDCTDCAAASGASARLEGTSLCFETCASAGDGVCDDGGPNAGTYDCSLGSDCTDCGVRLGICSDDCSLAKNGICNDAGQGAADASCATGTDCSDCGTRWGGRGQGICDATAGTRCNLNGAAWVGGGDTDGFCDCDDCAWDAADCSTADKCDGAAIDSCCNASDSCGWGDDDICDCNGWCTWDAADCGITSTPAPPADPTPP